MIIRIIKWKILEVEFCRMRIIVEVGEIEAEIDAETHLHSHPLILSHLLNHSHLPLHAHLLTKHHTVHHAQRFPY